MSQLEVVEFVSQAPLSVSVLYQIPQYIVITTGEILFSISGLQLAYSQVSATLVIILTMLVHSMKLEIIAQDVIRQNLIKDV